MVTTTGETFYHVLINGVSVGIGGPILPRAGQTYDRDDTHAAPDDRYQAFNSLASLTQGTLIFTTHGPKPVEELEVGMQVLTRDSGPKVVRWLGTRTVTRDAMLADPSLRPVHIAAGALGNEVDLSVSPQHRVLLHDWRTQLYFGLTEALVTAEGLVNGTTITQTLPETDVTYVYMAFDRHEMVCSAGLWSESYDVWSQVKGDIEPDVRDELFEAFPELAAGPRPDPVPYAVLKPSMAKCLC